LRRLAKASSAASIEGTGSSRGRFRRAFAALAGTGSIALMLALFAAPAASAATPWGFEQVSPVNKGAGAVSGGNTFTPAPDGESFLYTAVGGFDEVPPESVVSYTRYFAWRGEDKWNNQPTDPAFDPFTNGFPGVYFATMATLRTSANLQYSFITATRALTPGAIQGGSNHYIEDNRTGDLTLVMSSANDIDTRQSLGIQGSKNVFWVAPDGKAALFLLQQELSLDLPTGLTKWTAEGGLENVGSYESDSTTYKLTTVGNNDSGTREALNTTDALSNIYLTSSSNLSSPASTPVVLRRNGTNIPVSVSQREENEGTVVNGYLQAVSEGGEFALFFTNGDRLTDDTPTDGQYYLYRYDATNGALEYIAYGLSPVTAFRVVQMSPDGQTISFTSRAALTPGAVEAPSAGAKSGVNGYLWRNGSTRFVYAADVGARTTNLAGGGALSPNGRYFYFVENSQSLAAKFGTETVSLACAEPKAPTVPKACDQAYMYDAGAVGGKLDCLTCEPGTATGSSGDPFSNNSASLSFNNQQSWNVTDDGRAFFSSPVPLDGADTNGLPDVYEYHEGDQRLVSRAKPGFSSRFIDASRDGKAIFFTTSDQIAPQDTDRAIDLYVTREGAGFPYVPPVETPQCLGLESCHGGVPGGPSAPGAASSTFKGRENPAIATGSVTVKGARVHGATATIAVRVSGPGKVTTTGPSLRSSSKQVEGAGVVRLEVRLSRQGKGTLLRVGKLKRTLKVSFTPYEERGAKASRTLVFETGGKGGRAH
jgi:hypothetical protein